MVSKVSSNSETPKCSQCGCAGWSHSHSWVLWVAGHILGWLRGSLRWVLAALAASFSALTLTSVSAPQGSWCLQLQVLVDVWLPGCLWYLWLPA